MTKPLETVKSVLGVIDDNLSVLLQEPDGVGDHGQVFIRGGAQDFLHVQQPCLAENGDDRRFRRQQQPHLFVLAHRDILATGRTEGGQFGVLELLAFGFVKKLDVLGVGTRPAALDVMDAEGIKLFRDTQLIQHGKIDAFTLAAIAQGRIVNFDFGFHNLPARRRAETNTTPARDMQNIPGARVFRGLFYRARAARPYRIEIRNSSAEVSGLGCGSRRAAAARSGLIGAAPWPPHCERM